MTVKPTILVVDDEAYVRDSVIELIETRGFRALGAASVAAAAAVLAAESVDAVLTDLKMPGGSGLELLESVRSSPAPAPVIVMTGVGTVADAVAAMKGGAYDFLQKPVDPEQLGVALDRALEHRGLVKEVQALRSALGRDSEREVLAGGSAAIARVRAMVQQVASTETTVLITGESGTGKELAAAEIHRRSPRRARNLVRVNCAAIPDSLFESEFFGHRRGAFSGAIADRVGRFQEAEGGTIVLDEIGSLKPEMQAKLLRILESGEYQVVGESRTRVADVRVIGVSNEDLAARVREGTFRADLYYRLNVFPIEVPPLRTRLEDIAEIGSQLLVRLRGRGRAGDPPPKLAAEVVDVLRSYEWPGNVRELKNVIERALIVAGAREPDAVLFRNILEATLPTAQPGIRDCQLRTNLDAVEKQLITKALAKASGVKKDAAALLGIDPKNLGYYLRKHGLEGA
jgi:two-component system, NtrC family, response regulator AtoC